MSGHRATTHIALIRGINVGPNKRIAMADLRQLLADLGYGDVRTLLNSGNAILTAEASAADVGAAISKGLTDTLGVPAEVVVRSREQVITAMAADPFGEVAPDGSKHFLGFLAATPTAAAVAKVPELAENADTAPDIVRLIDDHLHLWCPNGSLKATFAKVNWDRRLGTVVTMRNWNTVAKLVELAAP